MSINSLENRKIMDWVPIVFVIFKLGVLGIGMFFAIKWHYDQGRKGKEKERSAVLRATGKAAVAFVLLLIVLVIVTFGLARTLGMELTF
ncbi:heme/copper-type cytochrome/quinol oxidase subunit 2 [Herbaspirillum sp. Sphag1AN]|nr:heme/copper-type cytochrome/quinol oxidase subunit 2 [Herbaspirillum sp. Sphag1AN]MBB3244076.1 heme/copper-type cytochrome/quinol oxidase subunit 2 [Herbaspirillum sp. Sphag64]